MGTSKKDILGGFSGTVGTVVGSINISWMRLQYFFCKKLYAIRKNQ